MKTQYMVQLHSAQRQDWVPLSGQMYDDKQTVFDALSLVRLVNPTNTYRVVEVVSETTPVCETCQDPSSRETVGLVCQSCGRDYGSSTDEPVPPGQWVDKA